MTHTPTAFPIWRTAGAVTLTQRAQVSLGDPGLGLQALEATLAPGTWLWQLRDTHPEGTRDRVHEVRLARTGPGGTDAGQIPDWDWVDDYAHWRDHPAPNTTRVAMRGVDTATIAWTIEETGHRGTRYADSYNPDFPDFTEGVLDAGRTLVTGTGWGDGTYPVTAQSGADGEVTEIRACYVTPDPAPLDAAEFSALVPDTFERARLDYAPGAPVYIRLIEDRYTRHLPDDDAPSEHRYERIVHADRNPVAFPDPDGFVEESEWFNRGLTALLGALWERATDQAKEQLITATATGPLLVDEHRPHHSRQTRLHTLAPVT